MKHSVEPVGKDVEMKTLNDVCTLITCGVAKRPEYVKNGIPFLSSKNVKADRFILDEYNFVSEYDYEQLTKYSKPEKGDILYTRVGSFGEAAVVDFDFDFAIFVSLTLIKPKKNSVNSRFLMHYLNSPRIKALANSSTSGIGVQNLNVGQVRTFPINLPPLTEQQRIADLLDAADALRQKDKALLEKYEALGQSLFLELFGDPRTNLNKFKKYSVDDIALKVTDGDHATPKRQENGIKLLSCRNVKNGFIDFEAGVDYVGEDEFNRMFKRCNPEKGDILISCSGTIGRTTEIKIDEPFVLVRSAALIKLKKEIVNPTYFEHYCRTQYMQNLMLQNANTSSQANLFTGPIKKLPVLIPPLELQNQFASQIELIEEQKAKVKENLEKSEELFRGLLGESFK